MVALLSFPTWPTKPTLNWPFWVTVASFLPPSIPTPTKLAVPVWLLVTVLLPLPLVPMIWMLMFGFVAVGNGPPAMAEDEATSATAHAASESIFMRGSWRLEE